METPDEVKLILTQQRDELDNLIYNIEGVISESWSTVEVDQLEDFQTELSEISYKMTESIERIQEKYD